MANGDKRLAEAIAGDMDVLTEEEMELECTKVLESHPEQVGLILILFVCLFVFCSQLILCLFFCN